jgi:hypothetical protein
MHDVNTRVERVEGIYSLGRVALRDLPICGYRYLKINARSTLWAALGSMHGRAAR